MNAGALPLQSFPWKEADEMLTLLVGRAGCTDQLRTRLSRRERIRRVSVRNRSLRRQEATRRDRPDFRLRNDQGRDYSPFHATLSSSLVEIGPPWASGVIKDAGSPRAQRPLFVSDAAPYR